MNFCGVLCNAKGYKFIAKRGDGSQSRQKILKYFEKIRRKSPLKRFRNQFGLDMPRQ
jgi:hypothetical protein